MPSSPSSSASVPPPDSNLPFTLPSPAMLLTPLAAAVADVGQAAEHRREDHDLHRDLRERGPRVRRERVLRHLRVEADLLERPVRDVEPRGPAGLLLAVDVLHVRAGGQPLPGLGQELLGLAPEQRVRGAGLHAGRRDAVGLALIAEGALLHPGVVPLAPLVLRDLEGAGHHAVAAADALVEVVDHRPVRRLVQRPDQAGRGAGRVVAVQALLLDEGPGREAARARVRLLEADLGVAGLAQRRRVLEAPPQHGLLHRALVPGLARHLTAAAADAARQIDQYALWHLA